MIDNFTRSVLQQYISCTVMMNRRQNKVESFTIHDNKDAKSAENEIHKIKDLIIEIIYPRG
jgi:hypothetical protein